MAKRDCPACGGFNIQKREDISKDDCIVWECLDCGTWEFEFVEDNE